MSEVNGMDYWWKRCKEAEKMVAEMAKHLSNHPENKVVSGSVYHLLMKEHVEKYTRPESGVKES